MKYSRISGEVFKNMLVNGLNNLKNFEERVNAINVFPVPDGDTGSNLRMTLENGINFAADDVHAGNYVRNVADGMFKGARGNSGVILSQIFSGLADEFVKKSILDATELCDGFESGARAAYRATRNPKEGTILTVAREGIAVLRDNVSRSMDIEVFFSIYLGEMRKSLAHTPEIMPLLSEAGVVDSGAFGYIIIIEGMLKYLQNEIIERDDAGNIQKETEETAVVSGSGESYGYCTEFILQLRDGEGFNAEAFNTSLDGFGGSIVTAVSGNCVKVHIHTQKPGEVLSFAHNFGEFESVKIENMQLQAENSGVSLRSKDKKLVKVVFCEGREACGLFEDFGGTVVPSLNPTNEEIVRAVKRTDSENVVIVPNSASAALNAEAVINLIPDANVTVLPTANILEGYYVSSWDDTTSDNNGYRMDLMRGALNEIRTFTVAKAERPGNENGVDINDGDFVLSSGDKVLAAKSDFSGLVADLVSEAGLPVDEEASVIIMKGKGFPASEAETEEALERFENLTLTILEGGFSSPEAIIGFV